MILSILRGLFLLLITTVTALYVIPNQQEGAFTFAQVALIFSVTLALGVLVVGVDMASPTKRLSSLSGVFLGLIGGLVVTYALTRVIDLIPLFVPPPMGLTEVVFRNLLEGVKVLVGLVCCYVGISLVMQTKDDFRFVIPYVEFARQIRGTKPTLLDTSVIIDGRIFDIAQTRILQGSLVIPRAVLLELQALADSADKLRRARGRRGLEILQKLQENPLVDISLDDSHDEQGPTDQILLGMALRLQARIMTNDFNLNKIATLRGIEVINLNDLARSLRPVALPGEPMRVHIVKPGEAPGQGVGYLEDGTMVVVENARQFQNQDVEITVTSTLQTSAGRMVFGKLNSEQAHASSNGGKSAHSA